jgi:hypothetical protein
MADLQPPKQAPEDPGAHELEGTAPSIRLSKDCKTQRHTILTLSRILGRPLLISLRGLRTPSQLELKPYNARGARR